MAFLRTLFWIALTVIVVVFSVRNWVPVPVNLFGDTIMETKLPVLLLIAFLAGFLPLYIWHRACKWRLARKVTAMERTPAAPSVAPAPPPAIVTSGNESPQAD